MKVTIRTLNIGDAETSYKWRNNPVIWELTGSSPDREVTFEMEREWIENVIARPNERRFAIEVDGHYVGNTYLTGIDQTRAELHYFIGEPAIWGKGIATLAIQLVKGYAKRELGLKKLFAVVRIKNIGSRKMLEKNGFSVVANNAQNDLIFEVVI